MQNILKKIGLSDKEIQVYLTMLEYGTRPASFIATKSGLNRGTTYNLLQSLITKNIIYQTVKAEVRQFTAHDPEKLLQFLDQESKRFQDLKSDIGGIIPDLQALQSHLTNAKPRFKYFEGTAGMRDLLEQTLLTKNKQLYAIISMEDFYGGLGMEYVSDEVDRRIKKKIWLDVIRSDTKDIAHQWPGIPQEYRNLRHMPKGLTPPDMTIYLWDENKVAFFASKQENYGLLIESPEFYQTQKMLFDGLWGNSTRTA